MIKRLLLVCLIFGLFSINTVVAEDSTTTTIKTLPEEIQIEKGDTFEIELYVEMGRELDSLAVNLTTWDPSFAKCLDIQPGNIFPTYLVWIGGKEVNNEQGYIKHIVISSQDFCKADGVFAILSFEALKDGAFKLNIPPKQFDIARAGERYSTQILSTSEEKEVIEGTENNYLDNNIQDDESKKEEITLNNSVIYGGLGIGIICLIFLVYFTKFHKEKNKEEVAEVKKKNENQLKNKEEKIPNNVIKVIRNEN
jgi:hypothetical protein